MEYKTIYEEASASFTEKKSEFIGHIAPVTTAEEAVDFIARIRSENRKATHNVYAYILRDGNQSRYSDDGEPQGTAGMPVLDVLKKEELTDVCCVVTRYFGGILLGGGGLVRAYSHSASIAVGASRKMIMCSCKKIVMKMDYGIYGKINSVIPEYNVKMIGTSFGTEVELSIYAKTGDCEAIKNKLTDTANGRISFVESDEQFQDFA